MRKWVYSLAAAAGLFSATTSARAALVPFTDNFNGDTVGSTTPTGFTAGGAAIYSIVQQSPGDNALQGAPTGAASGSEGISFTNIAGMILSLSTDARLTALTAGTSPSANFGFGLFGQSANFSSSTEYRLLLTTAVSGTPVSVAVGTNYTINVTATPVGNIMAFHATASDGTNTTVADYIDPSALTGTFFGYRTATAGTGTVETVEYDNFTATATTPEPGSIGLLGGVAGMLLMRRRRAGMEFQI
jgi:hypothetical protein